MGDCSEDVSEIFKTLEELNTRLTKIELNLSALIDRMWIPEYKETSIEYIQDIITKIDFLEKHTFPSYSLEKATVTLDSSFGVKETNIIDAIYMLSKELANIKSQFKGDFSNLYKK